MQILGGIIWVAFGMLYIFAAEKIYKEKSKNYTACPCIKGEVFGTHDVCGQRWLVKFTDISGNESLAVDDNLAEGILSSGKCLIPKRGDMEQVYYWPKDDKSSIAVSGIPVRYEMHFCNENYYALHKRRIRRRRVFFWFAGIAMMLAGVAILVW